MILTVIDDDFGLDDSLGGCTINLEELKLNEGEPTQVEMAVNNKRDGWFSTKAKIYLDISFTE